MLLQKHIPGYKKAANLFGWGTKAIRWIEVDDTQKIDIFQWREQSLYRQLQNIAGGYFIASRP